MLNMQNHPFYVASYLLFMRYRNPKMQRHLAVHAPLWFMPSHILGHLSNTAKIFVHLFQFSIIDCSPLWLAIQEAGLPVGLFGGGISEIWPKRYLVTEKLVWPTKEIFYVEE